MSRSSRRLRGEICPRLGERFGVRGPDFRRSAWRPVCKRFRNAPRTGRVPEPILPAPAGADRNRTERLHIPPGNTWAEHATDNSPRSEGMPEDLGALDGGVGHAHTGSDAGWRTRSDRPGPAVRLDGWAPH